MRLVSVESTADIWKLSGIISLFLKSQMLPFMNLVKIATLIENYNLVKGVQYILWKMETLGYWLCFTPSTQIPSPP